MYFAYQPPSCLQEFVSARKLCVNYIRDTRLHIHDIIWTTTTRVNVLWRHRFNGKFWPTLNFTSTMCAREQVAARDAENLYLLLLFAIPAQEESFVRIDFVCVAFEREQTWRIGVMVRKARWSLHESQALWIAPSRTIFLTNRVKYWRHMSMYILFCELQNYILNFSEQLIFTRCLYVWWWICCRKLNWCVKDQIWTLGSLRCILSFIS